MRDVAVIGVGLVARGASCGSSRSARSGPRRRSNALDDAGVDASTRSPSAACRGGLFVGQEHLGVAAAPTSSAWPACRRPGSSRPAPRAASRCGTAFAEVASGLADIVLVDRRREDDRRRRRRAPPTRSATAADQECEGFHGVTFPGLYAMMARAHMQRYGTTREQLAAGGGEEPRQRLAEPPRPVPPRRSPSRACSARPWWPTRCGILDCSPITDGAAARGPGRGRLGPRARARAGRSSGSPARARHRHHRASPSGAT